MNKVYQTIFLSFIITLILNKFKNKSNFSKKIMIPFLTFFLIKYLLGDWDINYTYTKFDIYYIITIIGTSSITNYFINLE